MAKNLNLDTLVKAADSLSSVSDKVDLVSTVSGNKKVAAKAAKLNEGVSQLQSGMESGKEVIHRVQQWGQKAPLAQTLTGSHSPTSSATTLVSSTQSTSSIQSTLSSLLGSSPSGLQFTLEAGSLPAETFSVISFDAKARYSELYCIELAVSSQNPAIDPSSVLDNRAVLSIWQNGEKLQTLAGMVTYFEQGDSGFRLTHYRLHIQPDLWRATLRRNSRIFQQKDIQTILSTILSENKVADYAFVLRYPHPEREFCVQYQESDFDFFQRLTAEEGIFYYFEQQDGQHRLMLTDDAATLSGNTTLPYNLNRNAQLQEKSITSFNRSERVRQSEVTLKDYTFKKPNWQATFNRPANDTQYQRTVYEHYDYPGRFKDGRGENYTRYRLESLRQDAHLGWGESNSPNLQVGKLFKLQNHPNESLNTEWQLVGIEYKGQQPQAGEAEAGDKATTLAARFEFMPREQTWRPQQRTKPRVDGPQVAIVTGPAGEEIYTDNFGRVRLQFLWDREGKFDDHSSCWIRVTQPWAGKGWGMMAIPRVGQEIVVDFLDGDPDQPIVTGRTYHANMPLPAELPAGKTQMHVMSQTYKDGGYNGMIMDDATGSQRLDFQAQKDMSTNVLNDQSATIQNNRSVTVVGGNETRTVQSGNLSESVKGDRSILVESGDQSRVIKSGNLSESVKGNRSISIEEGNQSLVVKTGDRGVEVQTGNDSLVVKTGNRSVEVSTGDDSKKVGSGNLYESVAQTRATEAKTIQMVGSESIVLNVGSATLNMTTDAITICFGDGSGITIKAGGVYAIAPEIHLNK